MVKPINRLTPAHEARFGEWADKWIEIGLRTGRADRPRFEAAVRDCYRYAELEPPKVIVWVSSPLVVALAAPIASYLLACRAGRRGAVRDVVEDAVRGAVEGAVGDAVEGAVRGAVEGAVGDAVEGAVGDAVGDAVRRDIASAISRAWSYYLGGQFWVGGYWWGGSWTSFFREVCNLELLGDLWDRARAYEATMESACWWWAHRKFVMVSERPLEIHRELVSPARPRGWGSHRLHRADGPAIVWPDGWGVYAWHGLRVPERVIMDPNLDAAAVLAEPNAETRRAMLERIGMERFIRTSKAKVIHKDDWGELYTLQVADETVTAVKVVNGTAEPDGHVRDYFLRVHPQLRPLHADGTFGAPQTLTARNAVASTFGLRGETYAPVTQT